MILQKTVAHGIDVMLLIEMMMKATELLVERRGRSLGEMAEVGVDGKRLALAV